MRTVDLTSLSKRRNLTDSDGDYRWVSFVQTHIMFIKCTVKMTWMGIKEMKQMIKWGKQILLINKKEQFIISFKTNSPLHCYRPRSHWKFILWLATFLSWLFQLVEKSNFDWLEKMRLTFSTCTSKFDSDFEKCNYKSRPFNKHKS